MTLFRSKCLLGRKLITCFYDVNHFAKIISPARPGKAATVAAIRLIEAASTGRKKSHAGKKMHYLPGLRCNPGMRACANHFQVMLAALSGAVGFEPIPKFPAAGKN